MTPPPTADMLIYYLCDERLHPGPDPERQEQRAELRRLLGHRGARRARLRFRQMLAI
jgi:hypothetical protein